MPRLSVTRRSTRSSILRSREKRMPAKRMPTEHSGVMPTEHESRMQEDDADGVWIMKNGAGWRTSCSISYLYSCCVYPYSVFFPFYSVLTLWPIKKFIHFPIPIFFVPFYRIAFALSLLLYLIWFWCLCCHYPCLSRVRQCSTPGTLRMIFVSCCINRCKNNTFWRNKRIKLIKCLLL